VTTNKRSFRLVLALACSFPASALADAIVVVELKTPEGASAEGEVVLTKGETKHRCTTEKGRCRINGVSGGMYTVEVSSPGRPAPKPKTVMIPPSGEVKLIVNAS
jgi:hypothetical protein